VSGVGNGWTRHQSSSSIPDTRHPTPDTRPTAPGTRNPAPDTLINHPPNSLIAFIVMELLVRYMRRVWPLLAISVMIASGLVPAPAAAAGPRTADSNNSIPTAADITGGVPLSDSINRNDDQYDYYRIDALAGQTLKASVNWTTSSADIRVDIRNGADGSIIGGEAQRSGSSAILMGETALIPVNGTYYVRINGNSGSSNYTINVTVDYPPELVEGIPVNGTINTNSDMRNSWYRVWLNGSTGGQAESVWIDMTKTNSNAYVYKALYDLLNWNGTHILNSSMSFWTSRTNLSAAASYTGWYYYRIYGSTGGGGSTSTNFTLYNGKYLAASESDNDYLNATPVKRSDHLMGNVSKAFDHYDWYSYKVVSGDSIIINATRTSSAAYFNVSIYNSRMELVSEGGSTGSMGSQPTVTLVTPAAQADDTYFVAVIQTGVNGQWGLNDDDTTMAYLVNFSSPNHLPELQQGFPAFTVNEDERARAYVWNHFRDPDGDNMTFKLTQNTNLRGEYNSAIGDFEIYGKPNWYGQETATLLATDALGASTPALVNVTVEPVEDSPFLNKSLPNVNMNQNTSYGNLDLSGYFIDNDTPYGDKLTWGVFDNGSVMVNITAAGKVTLTGDISFWGVQNLTFTATDKAQNTAYGLCRVTVNHVNQAPQVKSFPPDVTVDEDDAVVMDMSLVFWDPDGNPITILASGNSQINVSQQPGTMNITIRPAKDASGFFENIKLNARDDLGLGDNYVILKVTVTPINDPPRITQSSPAGDVVMSENQNQEFNVSAWDPESGPVINITWYLDGQPVMLGVSSYVFKPDFASVGNHTVMVSIGDGELFAMRSWNVTVLNVNREPTELKIVSPKPSAEYREGDTISFEGSAVDPDGDALVYSWHEGARELGKGRIFETTLAAGAHGVIMRVNDGTVIKNSTQVTFVVKANAQPQLYSIDPSSGQKYQKGAKIFFAAQAGDPDGDNLTYCWTENGKPLSTSSSFYKSDLPVGTHMITLTISDGRAAANTTLTIQVTQPPATGDDNMMLFMLVGVVAAVVVVAAVAAVLMRRKQPPVAVAQPVDTTADELFEAALRQTPQTK